MKTTTQPGGEIMKRVVLPTLTLLLAGYALGQPTDRKEPGTSTTEAGAPKLLRTIAAHDDFTNALAFSADGKYLVSGGEDKTVKVWDVSTGANVRTLTGHKQRVESVAITSDGKTIASGGLDAHAFVWDGESGKIRSQIDHCYSHIALTPDGKTLAVIDLISDSVLLFDPATGKERGKLGGHKGGIRVLALSADGKTLVSGGREDGTARVWDLTEGKLRTELGKDFGSILGVAVSADGKMVAVSTLKTGNQVWDVATAKVKADLTGGGESMAFSPTGKTCVVASEFLSFCDVATGMRGAKVRSPGGAGHGYGPPVAFSPDGKLLAAARVDGNIDIWDVSNRVK
jgi:WD40 repeat protein